MNLILGHNQFIGISHISEGRSREREKKFSDIKNIYNIVEKAADLGYKGMIIETHPRMLKFLEYYRKNQTFDIEFYLQVPYVQGYIQKMNEKGLTGLVSEVVQRGGKKTASALALKGIVSLARKDYLSMATSVLRLEIKPFTDIKIKAILLHNVMTDLALSLQMQDVFSEYVDFVNKKLKLKPGFITLNFPLYKNSLEKWKIKPSIVMTPINPKGFDMNPSKTEVESAIKQYKGQIIAMNILGGGAFSPRDVHPYLNSFEKVDHCVIGASSENHLRDTMEVFKTKKSK